MTTIPFGSEKIVVTNDNRIKLGTKGKAQPAGQLFGSLDRGKARQLRKTLRANGLSAIAAIPRIAA